MNSLIHSKKPLKVLEQGPLLAEFCQVSNLAEKDLDFAHALIYIEDKGHIDETVLGLFIKGKYDKKVARRLYVRMFISFVESVVFELKSEALDRKSNPLKPKGPYYKTKPLSYPIKVKQ